MIEKIHLKKEVIKLRKEGKTYSEILEKVPVAKSTLAIWLKSVSLAKSQEQRFTDKKRSAGLRGGLARKKQRLERAEVIQESAKKQVGRISKRDLFLIGLTLYWAEGSKEKESRPGSSVILTNMDWRVIKVFLRWLYAQGVKKERITFELFVHDSQVGNLKRIVSFWSSKTGFQEKSFSKVYLKKGNQKTKRSNINSTYFGTLRVRVKASSSLLRQIQGWTNGLYEGINKAVS